MFKPCLLVYLEGAEFKDEIQEIAEEKKIDFYFATRGGQLSQFVKTYVPFLMLVDLSGLDSGWLFRHISIIKDMKPDFPIYAMINDEQESIAMRAERYGCDKIIRKSKLIQNLPALIEEALRRTA